MGWANHRANRLVDLATLTFRTTVRAQLRKGVGWSALHSFGCTATSCYAEIKNARRRRNARTRNQFFKRANNANKMR